MKKYTDQVLSQMIVNNDVNKYFNPSIKNKIANVGVGVVLSVLAITGAGNAFANDSDRARNVGLGASALTGLIVDGAKPRNLPPECANIRGVNGFAVGGAAAAGTMLGNQIGKGNGNTIATLLTGFLGGTLVSSKEDNRIIAECEAILRQTRGSSYIPPNNFHNANVPTGAILYEGRTPTGGSFVVTMENSPGLNGLKGSYRNPPTLHVDSDIVVKRALDQSTENLMLSHEKLDVFATQYLQALNPNSTNDRLARYAVTEQDMHQAQRLNMENQARIHDAKINFERAYTEYATKRSIAANIYDNAVMDGFDITSYGKALEYIMPSKNALMTYDGRLPNRYGTLPNARAPR